MLQLGHHPRLNTCFCVCASFDLSVLHIQTTRARVYQEVGPPPLADTYIYTHIHIFIRTQGARTPNPPRLLVHIHIRSGNPDWRASSFAHTPPSVSHLPGSPILSSSLSFLLSFHISTLPLPPPFPSRLFRHRIVPGVFLSPQLPRSSPLFFISLPFFLVFSGSCLTHAYIDHGRHSETIRDHLRYVYARTCGGFRRSSMALLPSSRSYT